MSQIDKNEKTYRDPNCIDGGVALSGNTSAAGPPIHPVHVQYERGEPGLCGLQGKSIAHRTLQKPMVGNGR